MPKMLFFMKPYVLANKKALELLQEPSRSGLTAQSVPPSGNPEKIQKSVKKKSHCHNFWKREKIRT